MDHEKPGQARGRLRPGERVPSEISPTQPSGLGHGTVTDDQARPAALIRRLTPREREIVQLLAAGLKDFAIARQLSISKATVATHVRRIKARLGVTYRHQIVAWAAARSTAAHPDVLPDEEATLNSTPTGSQDPDVGSGAATFDRRRPGR
jgi:DNA-binding CsgD family transcriptional regulator